MSMNYEQFGRNLAGVVVNGDPIAFGRIMSGFFEGARLAQERLAVRLRKELMDTELRTTRLDAESQKERMAEEIRQKRSAEKARKERLAAELLRWLSVNAKPGEFVPTSRIAKTMEELNGAPIQRPGRVLGEMIAKGLLPGITRRHVRTGNGIIYMKPQGETF
jgi:hypothetical protein